MLCYFKNAVKAFRIIVLESSHGQPLVILFSF